MAAYDTTSWPYCTSSNWLWMVVTIYGMLQFKKNLTQWGLCSKLIFSMKKSKESRSSTFVLLVQDLDLNLTCILQSIFFRFCRRYILHHYWWWSELPVYASGPWVWRLCSWRWLLDHWRCWIWDTWQQSQLNCCAQCSLCSMLHTQVCHHDDSWEEKLSFWLESRVWRWVHLIIEKNMQDLAGEIFEKICWKVFHCSQPFPYT